MEPQAVALCYAIKTTVHLLLLNIGMEKTAKRECDFQFLRIIHFSTSRLIEMNEHSAIISVGCEINEVNINYMS